MWNYIWPIALVVSANTIYQICAKSMPENVNPLASLTITYLVGAVSAGVMYLMLNRGGNLLREYKGLNWAPVALGVVIVGLEVGFTYAYKAGWEVSKAALVASSFLSVVLLFVGALLYKETFTWNKIVGMIVCLVGLALINLK